MNVYKISVKVFVSPGYGRNSEYPGGLECLHVFKAPKVRILDRIYLD